MNEVEAWVKLGEAVQKAIDAITHFWESYQDAMSSAIVHERRRRRYLRRCRKGGMKKA